MEVTLTIKVEREEDFEVLRTIIDSLEHKKGSDRKAQQASGQPWTEEALLAFWDAISEADREVLREIAKKPDGYPANLLERNLSITAAELANCMRSIGHHVERTDSLERFERPVVRDWGSHIYVMPQDIVELIGRLNL